MKRKKLLLLGAFIVLMACLVGCGKTEINLNDYLETKVSGYDTVGKATYEIDYEGIINDNTEAFEMTEDDLGWMKLYMELETKISGELNNVSNLSNGDKIKFAWKVRAASIEEEHNVEFVYSPVEIEVQELKEARKIDPFELVEYSFSGSAPYGTISFTDYISDYRVSVVADKVNGLSNGDVVTLSIKANNGGLYESFFEMGVVPTEVTRKIVVSGLDSYLTKADDLTDIVLGRFYEDALTTFETISMHNWVEQESFKGLNYVGSYLIDGTKSYSWNSLLYNIYTVDVTNSEGTFKYFFYKYYKNAKLTADGELVFATSNDYIPTYSSSWGFKSGTYFQRGKYIYAGYEKLEDFYDDCIYEYIKSDYGCATNITEETFADANAVFEENRFEAAMRLWKNGELDAAKEKLLDCGDESYVDEKVREIKYALAEESVEHEDYGTAYKLWTELGDFQESDKKAKAIKDNAFEQAVNCRTNGECYTAYDIVSILSELNAEQEEKKEEIVNAYLTEPFKNAVAGDTVTFGKYKTYDAGDVKPLDWLVLKNNGDSVMLLCKQAVEELPFDTSGKDKWWSDCSLRNWLNKEFYETAFDECEKKIISLSMVDVDGGLASSRNYGPDTEDFVYVLSYPEVKEYKMLIRKLADESTGELSNDMWLRSLHETYAGWVYYLHENTYAYYISNDYIMGIWPVINIDISEK